MALFHIVCLTVSIIVINGREIESTSYKYTSRQKGNGHEDNYWPITIKISDNVAQQELEARTNQHQKSNIMSEKWPMMHFERASQNYDDSVMLSRNAPRQREQWKGNQVRIMPSEEEQNESVEFKNAEVLVHSHTDDEMQRKSGRVIPNQQMNRRHRPHMKNMDSSSSEGGINSIYRNQ